MACLQVGALGHLLRQVDRDDLGVAFRLEPMSRPLEAPLPLEVVGQLPVVHHGDVGERIRPIRVGARDVDVGLRRHPSVADRVRALEAAELVQIGYLLRVAQVLHDLERMTEREDLAAGDVLQVVGQGLQVALVPNLRAIGVLRLALDPIDGCADLVQPGFHLLAMAIEPFLEVEPSRVVGVGELEPDHHEVALRTEQREAGRVRPAMLHRLQHPSHLGPDVGVAIPVDDACDPAHRRSGAPFDYGRMSRYSPMSQSLTVAMKRVHSSRL